MTSEKHWPMKPGFKGATLADAGGFLDGLGTKFSGWSTKAFLSVIFTPHIFPDIQKLLCSWLLLLLNDVQSMLIVDFWCLSLLQKPQLTTVQYSPTYLRGWYPESQSSVAAVAASHKVVDAGVKELFPPFLLQHVGVPDGTGGTQQRCIGNSEYGRKWTWWRCLQTIFERTYCNSRINDTVDTYF